MYNARPHRESAEHAARGGGTPGGRGARGRDTARAKPRQSRGAADAKGTGRTRTRRSHGAATADKYQKVRLVGRGSFGQVWLVRHRDSGRELVAKEIRTHSKTERDEAVREARIMRSLSHKNIVKCAAAAVPPPVRGCGDKRGLPVFAMRSAVCDCVIPAPPWARTPRRHGLAPRAVLPCVPPATLPFCGVACMRGSLAAVARVARRAECSVHLRARTRPQLCA